MSYKLYIAGARGSRPVDGPKYQKYGGATSCYVITNGTYALVVDCGSGISNARDILKDCTKVDILLSHLHYDHIIGLLDYDVYPSGIRPTLYGTFDKWGGTKAIESEFTKKPYWPVQFGYQDLINVEWNKSYVFGDEPIKVDIFAANHPDNTCCVLLEAGDSKVLILSDYEHGEPLHPNCMDACDLLIYDGMYIDEEYPLYVGYGHSTVEKGIELAKALPAKQLVLTHLDPRKTDDNLDELERKIKREFPGGQFAKVGDVYSL